MVSNPWPVCSFQADQLCFLLKIQLEVRYELVMPVVPYDQFHKDEIHWPLRLLSLYFNLIQLYQYL